MAKILIVDDEKSMRDVLDKLFTTHGHSCTASENGQDALKTLAEAEFDLMTLDMRMPVMNGLEVLYELRKKEVSIPIIMITAHATIEEAGYALDLNVFDVVFKPFDVSDLLYTVNAALSSKGILVTAGAMEYEEHKKAPVEHGLFVAKSSKMQATCAAIKKEANHDGCLAIVGEQGIDKERVVQAIHENSQRASGPVLCLDCSTLNETEFLNHIFGGKDGADGEGHGALELADNGTLLLDHIETLPPFIQEQLASYIAAQSQPPEKRKSALTFDVRIIAGISPKHLTAIMQGGFSERLMESLMKERLIVPPLRERGEDILPTAMHWLGKHYGKPPFLSPEVKARLNAYHWPRNDEEFEEIMQSILSNAPSGAIYSQNLPDQLKAVSVSDSIKQDPRISSTQVQGHNIRSFLASKGAQDNS